MPDKRRHRGPHPEDHDLFGATAFVTTENSNYDQIQSVAEELGLLA